MFFLGQKGLNKFIDRDPHDVNLDLARKDLKNDIKTISHDVLSWPERTYFYKGDPNDVLS